MHGDGPDCGRRILIYGAPPASDGQPAVSGQEVCARVWVSRSFVCVLERASSLTACAAREKEEALSSDRKSVV